MFRSDEQAGRVAQVLCQWANRSALWGPNNRPTDELCAVADRKKGTGAARGMTPAEHTLAMLAMLCWNRTNDTLPIKLCSLFRLDDQRLRMVGELLVACAGRDAELDAWIQRWARP